MRRLALVGSTVLLLLVATVLGVVPSAGAARHHPGVETVARGLDNPRGLAVSPDGVLYVAEAGHAGRLCLGPGLCVGQNGRITAVDGRSGDTVTLAHGLPSLGGPFGAFGLGGIALTRHHLDFILGLNPQGFGVPKQTCAGQKPFARCVRTIRAVQAASGDLGRVRSLTEDQGWTSLAEVGKFDFDYAVAHPDPGNPEYAPGDANPFGLTATRHGGSYVVDAASNTLDRVNRHGDVSVLAFVPDPPKHKPIYDAAPTCAAVTPNGDVYVGTESSSVWRWDGTRLTKVLSGGKVGQVVGCVADQHGNVYLVNLSSRIRGSFPDFHEKPFDGSVVKVSPDLTTSYVLTGLNLPSGIALAPDQRHLYVAVNGLCPKNLSLITAANAPAGACPASGEVVAVRLHD